MVDLPEKSSRSHAEIAVKWGQIKTLRNLDIERLRARSDTKIATEKDWMIASLLALNRGD